MSKIAKIILVASLLINMLLLGVITGHAIRRTHAPELNYAQLGEEFALSDAEIVAVEAQLNDILSAHNTRRGGGREMRRALNDTLSAPSFDLETYTRQATAMHDYYGNTYRGMSAAIGTLAASLSDEERRLLGYLVENRRHLRKKQYSRCGERQKKSP